jgi:hypothetical protein
MNFKGWSTGENEARELYESLIKSGKSEEDSLQAVKTHLHINPIVEGLPLKNPRYFRGWDRFVAEMDFQIKWESEKKRLADLT